MLCVAMMTILACPEIAHAGESSKNKNSVIEKHKFLSNKSSGFNYHAKQKIKRGNKTLVLKSIKYDVVRKKGSVKKKVKYSEQEAIPDTVNKTVKGKVVKLKKDKVEDISLQKEYTVIGVTSNTLPKTQSFDVDGKTVAGTLQSLKGIRRYTVPFRVTGVYTGDKEAQDVIILGKEYPVETVTPAFEGYEPTLKNYLGLDDTYTFSGSKWTGESRNGDMVTRTAVYTGNRRVADYTGIYEVRMKEATYLNDQSEVVAICKYAPKYPLWEVLCGAGIAVLAVVMAIFIVLKRKKRKAEDEQ